MNGLGEIATKLTRRWPLLAGALLVLVLAIWSRPLTPWEFDEPLFILAVTDWDPANHQPPPPGYPLLIGTAALIAPLAGSPFHALVAMSIVGSAIGFVILALAFGRMTGNALSGVAGALVFYLSPALLVHAPLPISDLPALPLLALALMAAVPLWDRPRRLRRWEIVLFAAAAALAVGFRPQFSLAIVPLLLATLIRVRAWKERLLLTVIFGLVCLAWITPLILSFGGVGEWIAWERGQAGYFAAHDAGLSRAAYEAGLVAVRFIAHPWGMKWLAAPILVLGGIGAAVLLRRLDWRTLPVVLLSGPYLLFALAMMDPADAVRYAIPASVGTSALVSLAFSAVPRRFSLLPLLLVLVWGAGAFLYVLPVLEARRSEVSPPVQAARHLEQAWPPETIVAYELPLMPHSRLLIGSERAMTLDQALRAGFEDLARPLVLYADGASHEPGAALFSWPPSDAYSKLTRNHFRVVSVVPIPPEARYLPLEGVYPIERKVDGTAWRWLAPRAAIRFHGQLASSLLLELALPAEYPRSSQLVRLSLDGSPAGEIEVPRGSVASVTLPLDAESHLEIETASSYRPAADPRELGVMLRRFRLIR